MTARTQGILAAVLGASAFATASIFSKMLLQYFSPVTLAALSQVISIITLLLIFGFVPELRKLRHLNRRQLSALLAIGALAAVVAPLCLLRGLQTTTATNAILIGKLDPLLVDVIAVLWLKETLTRRQVSGIAVMLVGMYIIITNGTLQWLRFNPGDLYIVGFALAVAFATNIFKKYLSDLSPDLAVLARNMVGASVLLLLPFMAGEEHTLAPWRPHIWLTLVAFAIVTIIVAQYFWYRALELVSAATVSSLSLISPLVGIILAVIILGESLTPAHFVGGSITLGGLFLLISKHTPHLPVRLRMRAWHHH
jgi:drug/metabolite transporter (DMT)-like permease